MEFEQRIIHEWKIKILSMNQLGFQDEDESKYEFIQIIFNYTLHESLLKNIQLDVIKNSRYKVVFVPLIFIEKTSSAYRLAIQIDIFATIQ